MPKFKIGDITVPQQSLISFSGSIDYITQVSEDGYSYNYSYFGAHYGCSIHTINTFDNISTLYTDIFSEFTT